METLNKGDNDHFYASAIRDFVEESNYLLTWNTW